MTDIVENLKEGLAGLEIQTELQPLLNEAADEITRLRAENQQLREALYWIAGTALTEPKLMVEKARAALKGKNDE